MNNQFKYHCNAVKLLPEVPPVSASSVEALIQRERALGITFPASIREWYSLENAVEILERYSNNDWPFSMDQLGEPFDDWYQGGPKDFLAENLLLFMQENQGVCNWAIKLDGRPDPPVVVEVDTAPNAVWLPCADRFSTFIWCQIWDRFHPCCTIWATSHERRLSKVDLDFLRSQFRELPTTTGWPGTSNYRFESPKGDILIWNGEDGGQVDWFVYGRSISDFRSLLHTIWHCGSLSHSLYGDGEADDVIARLRRGSKEK